MRAAKDSEPLFGNNIDRKTRGPTFAPSPTTLYIKSIIISSGGSPIYRTHSRKKKMKFPVATCALLFPLGVLAMGNPATDHPVMVGAGGAIAYSPDSVTASIGDTITFQFAAVNTVRSPLSPTNSNIQNHSVAEADFAAPCKPSNGGIPGPLACCFQPKALQLPRGLVLIVGIWSGFIVISSASGTQPPVAGYKRQTSTTPTTFVITVNNTNPTFFYCAQVGHCNAGMVFAINPSVPPVPHASQGP